MKPEAKFAVVTNVLPQSNHLEIVASSLFAYIIMLLMLSPFGIISKALFQEKFPFSFSVNVNPIFDFDEVVSFIQDNLDTIEEAMNDN